MVLAQFDLFPQATGMMERLEIKTAKNRLIPLFHSHCLNHAAIICAAFKSDMNDIDKIKEIK